MSIIDVSVRTITCNTCELTVSFNQKDHQQALNDNPWLRGARVIQTGDGRNLVYCTDECEIKGVATGIHNLPEQKKVVPVADGTSANAIRLAAEAAERAEKATKDIKAGKSTKLQIVS